MKNYSHIRHYLLKEQGFDDDAVKAMSPSELEELWDYYHEDYE